MKLDKNRDRKLKSVIVRKDVVFTKEKRPIIGITFLDRNNYGLDDLIRCYRGDKNCVNQLNDFLEKARKYTTISELITNHASHNKFKNTDSRSLRKFAQIQDEYEVETSDICHLHCNRGGTGRFVLHGFILNNCFEIVWLDVKHDVHDC